MAESGYDPTKSKVSNDTMDTWRSSNVSGDIREVPGIGPATAKALAAENGDMICITNTYQLIGQYLTLKGPESDGQVVSTREMNQKFWFWLKTKGITAHRSAIVLAISTKVATFFPGFHDANEECDYEDDNE